MALTTTVRIALEGKRLTVLFDDHQAEWAAMVQKAYDLMAGQVPGGRPTVDDVRKVLLPMVELNRPLRDYLARQRCTEKHWVGDFTDYILDEILQPTPERPGAN